MPIGLLDARGVAAYLADCGLLARDAESRVSVSVVSRRNHNLIVSLDGEPIWFVKQMQHLVPEIAESLRRRRPAIMPRAGLSRWRLLPR